MVGAKVGKNEHLVSNALRAAGRPLGAYDLIELLHEDGIVSPTTVYRALKRLTELGLAHRIESLNAFVACSHGSHRGVAAFAICGDCGTVTEFHEHEVVERLGAWAHAHDFTVAKTTIELRGHCHACTSRPQEPKG
jgi:Fur family zinc uptake transcriptional regulator